MKKQNFDNAQLPAESKEQSKKRYLAEKMIFDEYFEVKTKQGVIDSISALLEELPDTFVSGKFNFKGLFTLSITTIESGKALID